MSVQIDDVMDGVCIACTARFFVEEGWLDYCAACWATIDDHHAGGHNTAILVECRFCLVSVDEVRAIAG